MAKTEINSPVFSFPDGSKANNMSRKGSSKDLNDARNESGADLSQTPSMQKVQSIFDRLFFIPNLFLFVFLIASDIQKLWKYKKTVRLMFSTQILVQTYIK